MNQKIQKDHKISVQNNNLCGIEFQQRKKLA